MILGPFWASHSLLEFRRKLGGRSAPPPFRGLKGPKSAGCYRVKIKSWAFRRTLHARREMWAVTWELAALKMSDDHRATSFNISFSQYFFLFLTWDLAEQMGTIMVLPWRPMCHDNLQDYSYNIFVYGIFYTLTNDHHAAINYKWIALPNIQNGMQKVHALSV